MTKMPEKSKSSNDIGSIFSALLIGLINGVLCIPVTISFCSIIFRDNVFQDQMPKLVKLVLFSSAVHQICFSTFSSLPFAVGQVQDAGLIFLSAIATSVVEGCAHGENIIPTTLFVLGICTALLGVMLLIVAKLKLASVIQYLPMPVIGGYLAYIGFFCGKAGLAMMGGIMDPDFRDISPKAVILMAPGLIIGLTMYMLLRNVRSPFVLPISMGVILAAFYTLLWFSGGDFQDARDYGWIAEYSPLEPFYRSWMLYDVTRVEWGLLSTQWLRLICMFLVVAFSSSLDVAAIEMEVGLPLNYNTELFTVGLSNVVSGLAGGYTGSYIFSQTIFNLRRKVSTRWCGFTVAVLELIVVVMPVSVTSFVPKLFFGSLLILISVDLMFEWLVSVRVKMTTFEYCVCLATFMAIILTNIEIGMMMGILLAMFSFVVTYARLQTVSVASLLSSTVVRTFEDRAILIANRGKIVTISLKGYIFFGSAVSILEEVKRHVIVQTVTAAGGKETESLNNSSVHLTGQSLLEPVVHPPNHAAAELKPLLSEGMKSLNSYQSAAPVRGKLSPQQIEEFNHSAMMPRYSFSLNVNNPQALNKHPMMVMKRSHSLFTERPHEGSVLVGSGGGLSGSLLSGGSNSLTGSIGAGPASGGSGASGGIAGSYQASGSIGIAGAGAGSVGSAGSVGGNAYMGSAGASAQPVQGSLPNSGVIGSLLFKAGKQNSGSNVGSFSDVPHLHFSDDSANNSANNSAHGPPGGGRGKKKRTVSFDQHKPPTADIEMGLLAVALANVQHNQNQQPPSVVPPSVGAGVGGIGTVSTTVPSSKISVDNSGDNSPLVVREPSSTGSFDENPAKKKSMSLFATIWQNQQKKREKVKDTISSPRKEFNSLTPSNRFSPKYSPPDPSMKPAASALKSVSAFPDVNFDTDSLSDNISTEYLILDFSRVLGVDATAARSCFMMLVQLMRASQVIVVFAHMSKEIESMLRNQRVIIDSDIVIPHLDDALEWCEDRVLSSFKDAHGMNKQDDIQKSASSYSKAHQDRQNQEAIKVSTSYGDLQSLLAAGSGSNQNSRRGSFDLSSPPITYYGIPQPKSASALRKILIDYLETEVGINPQVDVLLNSETLLKYFKFINFNERELIFDVDDWADALFFIEKGMVEIVSLTDNSSTHSVLKTRNGKAIPVNTPCVQRVNKVSAGGAFGEADFFLGRKHSVRAYTMTNCHCWILDRESYANMELQHPNLCLLIQHTLLKSLAISSTCSMYSLTNTGGDSKDGDEPGAR